jgi:hypothetical protein
VTFTRVLQQICYLLYRSGCFRPSDRLAGQDSHPLEIADFSRRTEFWASRTAYARLRSLWNDFVVCSFGSSDRKSDR